jgi:hypothetical protein
MLFNYQALLSHRFNPALYLLLLIAAVNHPALADSPLNETKPEHQQHWLNVDNNKVLSVYIEEKSDDAYGAALILPNFNEHPANRGAINNLRIALASQKWHTLALDLTAIDSNNTQLNTDIIQAGIELLNSKGIYNIVIIGKGTGATHAIQYLAENTKNNNPLLASIRTLITIDADHSTLSNINILEQISALSTVYLDAYTSNDQQQRLLAQSRRQAARHLINTADRQKSRYIQLKLPPPTDIYSAKENATSKRIRGWLNKNIAGFSVSN